MSNESRGAPPPLDLDDAKAAQMIGKLVLVGVTRFGGDGQVQGLEQFAGTVLRVSAEEGLVLADGDDGHERYLPPMLDRYLPAAPGEYQLRSSGVTVIDPDYLSTWELHARQ